MDNTDSIYLQHSVKELKDDVQWDTFDMLKEPTFAAKQLELQYVHSFAIMTMTIS